MRKIIAFLPAALITAIFCYLTVTIRAFVPILFFLMLSFIASGVLLCIDKHLPGLVFGIAPAVYFVYAGLTSSDPASGTETAFLWISGGIVLFYICYYTVVLVYHRELNGK